MTSTLTSQSARATSEVTRIAVPPSVTLGAASGSDAACPKQRVPGVDEAEVWRLADSTVALFEGGMAIDADGAPNAYHPQDDASALDWLANAGVEGNWWALATDADGVPFVQGRDDPCPGFYVSTTTLQDESYRVSDPRRYVDADSVPYFVLPYDQQLGAELGDLGVVWNRTTGRVAYAIFADLGPQGLFGEGSVALARALDIDESAKWGGAESGVVYLVFPGSGNGRPRSVAEIDVEGARLSEEWGGMRQLEACLSE